MHFCDFFPWPTFLVTSYILLSWNKEKVWLKYNILSSQLNSYTESPSYRPVHKDKWVQLKGKTLLYKILYLFGCGPRHGHSLLCHDSFGKLIQVIVTDFFEGGLNVANVYFPSDKLSGSYKARFWTKNQCSRRKPRYFRNSSDDSSSKIEHAFKK